MWKPAVLAAAVFMTLSGAAAMAQTVYEDDGVAIEGYDPVAYFKQGKPVEGTDEFPLEYRGVTWHFSSAENRAAFEADPEHYAPQYGGFCAYAVAQGQTASIEPDAWKIVDGKLYLNYSQSIARRWEKDMQSYIKSADQNWPGIEKKLAE